MTDQNTAAAPGFRLSPEQESAGLAAEGSPSFTSCTVAIDGALDVARLGEALAEVVRRHEILRTTFATQPGIRVPSQVIHDELAPAIDLDANARNGSGAACDPVHGPILHAALVSQSSSEHVLTLHSAGGQCRPNDLADPPRRAGCVLRRVSAGRGATPVRRLRRVASRNATSEDALGRPSGRDFWSQREPRRAQPPLLEGRPGTQTGQVKHTSLELDAKLREAVRRSAETLRVNPAVFLEVCWHVLVSRLSGEPEVSSDGSLDGRKHEELTGALGALTPVADQQPHGGGDVVRRGRRSSAPGACGSRAMARTSRLHSTRWRRDSDRLPLSQGFPAHRCRAPCHPALWTSLPVPCTPAVAADALPPPPPLVNDAVVKSRTMTPSTTRAMPARSRRRS